MNPASKNFKKSISLRVYFLFLVCVVGFVCVLLKVGMIQTVEGAYWNQMAEKYQLRIENVSAPRGSIYGDHGELLAISTARYSLYFDGGVSTIGDKQANLFRSYISQTCNVLSNIRPQYSPQYFYSLFRTCVQKRKRYELILDHLTFEEYTRIKQLPLIDTPSHLGGFILASKEVRSFLYGNMARRTIGNYSKEYNATGIESAYNRWLSGSSGKRLTQKIGSGVFVPVDGAEIIPSPGDNVITTINIDLQDIASHALMAKLKDLDADWGSCVVMEVATGAIKAISNLKRGKDGTYDEEFNYAISNIEPGSTVKTISLMALLEDQHVDLEDSVDISNGSWVYNGLTIKDSEHGDVQRKTTVKHAFEISSNVGISKLVKRYYEHDASKFMKHFSDMKISEPVITTLPGEQAPNIKFPNQANWSNTSLLWSSFGYELALSPISLLTFYNAIANDGVMMQPFLVQRIEKDHSVVEKNEPQVRMKSICNRSTLKKVQAALEGVVQNGTASSIKTSWYPIAGKTGTSKVYSPQHGYNVNHYLGSFVGYFPADHPKYSCIVFVQTKENSPIYYGSSTALPVFKAIADRAMARLSSLTFPNVATSEEKRSFSDSNTLAQIHKKLMPSMKNWKLSDVIYFCESNQIPIGSIRGKGRVITQSIPVGVPLYTKRQTPIQIGLQ